MITEWVVSAILSLVLALVELLPGEATDTIDLPSFGPMVGLARLYDSILPVHEVVDFAVTLLGVSLVIFNVKLIDWLYHKVRG
jgi:hypothetical protein